jgi:predicted O-methyltransferase YrrM
LRPNPIASMPEQIPGQLNETERKLLVSALLSARTKPEVALEVGTWLGGGSTVHLLKALEANGRGHLWGIEADRSIYDRMIENLREGAPEAVHRFTPLFGFSQKVIPQWLAEQGAGFKIDFAFLDGGNNPNEQIVEFRLIDPYMPVGAVLAAHDAKLRKGKWLAPYVSRLDNWQSKLHDVSEEGLFQTAKTAAHPSKASLRAAQSALFKMRLEPAEVAAAVTPRRLCRTILKMLPDRLSRSLSDGRK